MERLLAACSLIFVFISVVFGTELTFELPDSEKQCFFEQIEKGVQSTIEFQVKVQRNITKITIWVLLSDFVFLMVIDNLSLQMFLD